jgi:hypothetical protein
MPFIQLDYTNIAGQVTQNGSGMFGVDQTIMNSKNLALPALARSLGHSFTNMVSFGGSAYQTTQLGVTANPVINNNEVYDAYLEFLAEPGRLIKSCEPPPPGAAHIVRSYGKDYYWVPSEYRFDFLRLSLVTTAQRGQPLSVPVKFENTVISAKDQMPDRPGLRHRFEVQLSTKIPSGSGRMDAVINGTPYQFELQMYNPRPDRQATPEELARLVAPGKDTDWFLVILDQNQVPIEPQVFAQSLAGQTVKIDLDFFKPTLPTTDKILESIRNETQLIRFNQFNPPVPPR